MSRRPVSELQWFLAPILALFCMAQASCGIGGAPYSGFLASYRQLRAIPNHEGAYRFVNRDVDIRRFDKVMLDHVVIYYDAGVDQNTLSAGAMRDLCNYLETAILLRLQRRFVVVHEPGPNILRIRTALTDVRPDPSMLDLVPSLSARAPVDLRRASIEAEVQNSENGVTVAAFVDRRIGRNYNWRSAYSRWYYAREAFNAWARFFSDQLDTLYEADRPDSPLSLPARKS